MILLFLPLVKILADARVISNSPDLSFDRAILTGESKPIMATSFSEEPGTNYLESSCIAMQGTFCVNGTGRGIVVSTGDNTILVQLLNYLQNLKLDYSTSIGNY